MCHISKHVYVFFSNYAKKRLIKKKILETKAIKTTKVIKIRAVNCVTTLLLKQS